MQPIEVDGEWAGQHVACPFCQRVVTAPTESTLREIASSVPPMARKAAAARPFGAAGAGGSDKPGANRIALFGFSFSIAAIFLLILGQLMLLSLLGPLGPNPTPAEAQQRVLEAVSNSQTTGRALLGVSACALSFACWVAGLVLSVLGMTPKQGPSYRLAVAGLACAAIPPGTLCLGLIFG